MQFIETDKAPLPAGHYSQAIVVHGLVFVSGILPIIPNTDRQIAEGIIAQTEQVFANLEAILIASASNLDQLVNVQIFIPDVLLWGEINSVYERLMGAHKPARTIIPCGKLHYDVLVEVNAVAALY